MSPVPLTETGAGAILASIKEGLGRGEDEVQTASSSTQPRKRRHVEEHEQQKPVAAYSIPPHTEGRGEKPRMYTRHC